MTGREALDTAINIAGQIEVKGKQNLTNLLYVIQVLEALKGVQNNPEGGKPDGEHNNPQTVEN